MTQTHMIPFHGERVLAVETPQGVFVPVKPLAESLGLGWSSQHAKLSGRPNFWRIAKLPMATNGNTQTMICFPLSRLPIWVLSIASSKVKKEHRARLERLQEQCIEDIGKALAERLPLPGGEGDAA